MIHKSLFIILTIVLFSSCSSVANSMEYSVGKESHDKVMQRRFRVLEELKIVQSEDELWVYYIKPKEASGQFLASVPVGSLIEVTSVSKSKISGFDLYSYKARFVNQKIFSKKFGLTYWIDDTNPDTFSVKTMYLLEVRE